MKLILVVAVILLLLVLLVIVSIAVRLYWWRSTSSHISGRNRADAAAFLRAHHDDPQLPDRLQQLAVDSRTPNAARRLLLLLARYLRSPLVLAPESVPFLGRVDEVTIGSVLLWLSWRSLPQDRWEAFVQGDSRPVQPRIPHEGSAARSSKLIQTLRRQEQSGQHAKLLSLLDETLPTWPVSASLIEATRALLALTRNIAAAEDAGVPEAVTSRLTAESRQTAGALWNLADRVTTAAAFQTDSSRLQTDLEHEEKKLIRLLAALREARDGLAELTLAGTGGRDELRRAEGRFQALAETARELRDFDRGEVS